jgi:transcriptional regulator with XRE-family HTH domain
MEELKRGPAPRGPPDLEGHLQRLARRIRSLREARGLTQEDFAQASGISVSFASLLERGERSPSYETLVQVAAALGVPLAELLRESEAASGEAYRLVDFVRTRGLGRTQVDQLLAVARALFPDEAPPLAAAPAPVHCREEGCTRQVLARGLCVAHYHRARRARR